MNKILFLPASVFLFSICLFSCSSKPKLLNNTVLESADSIAIMKSIETETRNFYKKDHAAWSNSFVHSPEVFWLCVEKGVSLRAKGWEDLSQFVAVWMEENPKPMDYEQSKFTNTKVKMEGAGELAFVVIEGSNLEEDGKTTRFTMGSRVMKKVDGNWKILSMVSYPNDTPGKSTPNIYVHQAEL